MDKLSYSQKQRELIQQIEISFKKGEKNPTLVGAVSDYANDDKICLTSVFFLPDDIKQIISQKIIAPLRKIEPWHYYYPKNSMHVTIKNICVVHQLPTFTDKDIEKVKNKFLEIIPKFPKFDVLFERLFLFPSSISIIGFTNKYLGKLVKALDNGLNEVGLSDDKKYFSNEVFFINSTFCRFTKEPGEKLLTEINEMMFGDYSKCTLEEISLITTNSVCFIPKTKIVQKYKLS